MGFDGIQIGRVCATNLMRIRRNSPYRTRCKFSNYFVHARQIETKPAPTEPYHFSGHVRQVWSNSETVESYVVLRALRSDSTGDFVHGPPESNSGHMVGFVSENWIRRHVV